jgi:dTDP-4-dehydrorhamnose 3,5-epimerase-like enzyme
MDIPTTFPKIVLVKPHALGDMRRFFMEPFRADQMTILGISGRYF